MRSPLRGAAGLGSAKQGVEHWWLERVTAVALVPLTLWLAVSLVILADGSHASFIAWLKSPFVALSMLLLLIALFTHLALGLQVVIEDYVHSRAKIPLLVAMRFACLALALAGMLSMLRIFFSD
jgi:succinate dehydrogenase / fumarate reductase membrane anchor subunit